MLEALFLPGRRVPGPSLLRTHPDTGARIERLLSLEPRANAIDRDAGWVPPMPARLGPQLQGPRWHATGLWH